MVNHSDCCIGLAWQDYYYYHLYNTALLSRSLFVRVWHKIDKTAHRRAKFNADTRIEIAQIDERT